MKPEIDTQDGVVNWIAYPQPAVFQGQDLRNHSDTIADLALTGCVFLGCQMKDSLAKAAAEAKCMVLPPPDGLPFEPFTAVLYTPGELYDKYDPANSKESYKLCLDYLIYDSVTKEVPSTTPGAKPERVEREVDVDVTLMRRVHDWSIADALEDLLKKLGHNKCVAIMGGHDALRSSPVFRTTAFLALSLTQAGFTIVTGGGPGLMEAGNLGAFAAGFDEPEKLIDSTISWLLKVEKKGDSDRYDSPRWLEMGFRAWKAMGHPKNPDKSRNIGIPTWFYGHEPPNFFATDVAKYFENSVREEGLLAVARGGIIYADGNGGTVQEIFQDANQNYYRVYDKKKSPMVLFNTAYWNPPAVNYNNPKKERQKPAYLLLHKLATEKAFDDYLFMSDVPEDVVVFIKDHPPVA